MAGKQPVLGTMAVSDGEGRVEWVTLALLLATYGVWACAVIWLPGVSVVLAVVVAGLAAAFQSSLSHEAIHGHPTKWAWVNGVLASPALVLVVPYLRFYDTHHAHHMNERLTDPYDDPETNYQALPDWTGRPAWQKALFRFNNTLAGRMLVGPWIGTWAFLKGDVMAMLRGDRRVMLGWVLHLPALALVLGVLVAWGALPWSGVALSVWIALAVLKIRTFLEHQAHEKAGGRTVIIEDRGPLALMFLNNNLHAVHHMHPRVPWYRLPALYDANRERYQARNEGYLYTSYGEIFRRYLARRKDDVPHPFWRRD
jgi:fatty acid desaturase